MVHILTDLTQFPASLSRGALAIGNFDGVHRGHAGLVAQLVSLAKRLDGAAIVLTFDPPPQAVLVPERKLPPPLTTIERRAQLLGELGIDALVAYPTDKKLLALTARDFFQQVVVERLGVRGMVEGPNFRFGRDRAGDTKLLDELCARAGMQFEIAQAAQLGEAMISSSRIRSALASGDIEAANAMLTRPFEILGVVGNGAKRGRELGFPTANLSQVQSFVPAAGVYAGAVLLDGQEYKAAINIGPNPTFGDDQSKIELHLLGWDGDLYGRRLTCRFMKRIREVRKFESFAELRRQIQQDVAAVGHDG
jgi:riboflavin kinase / FMN adenylyltransferase